MIPLQTKLGQPAALAWKLLLEKAAELGKMRHGPESLTLAPMQIAFVLDWQSL